MSSDGCHDGTDLMSVWKSGSGQIELNELAISALRFDAVVKDLGSAGVDAVDPYPAGFRSHLKLRLE